jgi:hypothetical protein
VVDKPIEGGEPHAQVRQLADASNYSMRHTYRLLKAAGIEVDPRHGVPMSQARKFLKTHSRPARKAQQAAISRQLHDTVTKAFGAQEGAAQGGGK